MTKNEMPETFSAEGHYCMIVKNFSNTGGNSCAKTNKIYQARKLVDK